MSRCVTLLHRYTPETQAGTLQATLEKAHHYQIIKLQLLIISINFTVPKTRPSSYRSPKNATNSYVFHRCICHVFGARRFFVWSVFRGPGPLSHLASLKKGAEKKKKLKKGLQHKEKTHVLLLMEEILLTS